MKHRGSGMTTFAATLLAISAVAATAQEEVLYNFKAGDGGVSAGLIFDAQGNLYGMTNRGGNGYGSIFELSPAGDGTWTENDIYRFSGSETDPIYPYGVLAIDAQGNLYGTTEILAGGGFGTVFELSPPPDPTLPGWRLSVLYNFYGPPQSEAFPADGAYPMAGVTFDTTGNLYGTTETGGMVPIGLPGDGTVFEMSPAAGGGWTEKLLYSFDQNDGTGGRVPEAGLIFDAQGNLYSTTTIDGANGSGTVYELSPAAGGSWTEKPLYAFPAITTNPYSVSHANLVFDAKGNLYGVNPNGGAYSLGAIFELSPAADGSWTEKTLYNFGAINQDAQNPESTLIFDANGNLLGATGSGGAYGGGAVFELIPAADGTWTERILHSFGGNSADGAGPGGIVIDTKGNLYGTTGSGGANGDGTFFEILSTYAATVALPNFSPGTGTYTSAQTVKIADATANTTIYYTTNGDTPTTSSTQYTQPITVSQSLTLKAIAVTTGNAQSAVAAASYTINEPVAATPVITPATGTYPTVQAVTITDTTPGAVIYYTTDGTNPGTSSNQYTGPILVTIDETVKAMAVATNYFESAVASANYAIIGAPSALGAPASAIGRRSATLNAIVNTEGLPGFYFFEYGYRDDERYGHRDDERRIRTDRIPLASSTSSLAVSATLDWLRPETAYYYRVVVVTDGGVGSSAMLPFTTK
jgi:uncharacterized repeat protein (TIGR03803 family)